MENQDQKIILPEYKLINKIKISHNVISDLLKFKSSKKAEGILFGRETNDELIISSIIPYSLENPTIILSTYLESNRYDYMRVGFFFVENNFDILSQNRIKTFVEFQKTFPNNIIIMIDSSSLNINTYPFKIFRMSKELMDKIDMIEIEENASLSKKENVDEFYKNFIFKKLNPTLKLIEKLNFEIISDQGSLMKNLVEKNYDIKNLIDEIESNSDDKLNFNYTFNKRINELNKNCEKFIEEQKKYINYYRNKKYLNLGRKKEGIKKGGGDEKLDLMEIGIQSNNIKSMNEKIKELIELNKINKFSNFNLI
jgi:hypothetical protein